MFHVKQVRGVSGNVARIRLQFQSPQPIFCVKHRGDSPCKYVELGKEGR
jgi:hypothetical protein